MDFKSRHFEDLARRAISRQEPVFTSFLSPCDISLALSITKKLQIMAMPYGGYTDAERQLIAYYSYQEPNFPIDIIKIVAKQKTYTFQHRQVLGSLLSLGIKREVLGDILLANNKAYVFCLNTHSQLIIDSLYQIAAMSVDLSRVDAIEDSIANQSTIKRISLSSLRLDACIAGALNLSRSKSLSLIQSGNVFVNFIQSQRPDQKLEENFVISIRSYGRIIIRELLPLNKKGKTPCLIECFLKK